MSPYTYSFLLSLLMLFLTLYFIKKRMLEFKYSILWIITSLFMIVFSTHKELTDLLAAMVHISYPPAFLFVTALVFILVLIFYLTLVISDVQKKMTKVIQEVEIIMSCSEKGEQK